MSALWMTSLRPIGKSIENDKIQDLFIKSVNNIDKPIKFSLTQFDDDNVEDYLIKNKINCYFSNIEKKKLPKGKKYSNKLMLENSLDQFLKGNFKYFIYSTADLLIPKNIFSHIENIKEFNSNDECCALVYPNILKKNGLIKSYTTPHYGIDIFIFKITKKTAEKFKSSIINWHQYDWGINDNFYVSVCELLNLPIFNIYKDINIIKHENDFKTINENRDWQINSWNENQKYFLNFLKDNNLPKLYATGSYYYLLFKIFRLKDVSMRLIIVYIKFYLKLPFALLSKLSKKL
tara:strand:+ start:174 stop:1046 length:873 start_codon:yes stop_codon:yes gene_type:complete